MIFKFKEYIKESQKPHQVELQYYSFDWDDNIMKMPTVIHMEHLVDGNWIRTDVSTEEFARVRSLEDWRYAEDSFLEFRDFGPRGQKAFLEDVKKGLAMNQHGPSWDKFIECLTKGSIFSIITARGHESETIREACEYIIDNELTDEQRYEMAANLMGYLGQFSDHDPLNHKTFEELKTQYLDNCDFVGITSPTFVEKYPEFDVAGGAASPEEAKKKAMEDFIQKVHDFGSKIKGAKVKVGFSDDDPGNVEEIHKFFKNELSLKYTMQYNVYDTSDFDLKHGKRMQVNEDYGQPHVHNSPNLVKFKSYNQVNNEFMDGMENLPKDKVSDVIDSSAEIFGVDDEEGEYPSDEMDYHDELDINTGPSNIRKHTSHPYGFWNAPSAHQGNIETGYPKPVSGVRVVGETKVLNFNDFNDK